MLRVATEGDFEEIVELVNRAYRGQDGWSVEVNLIAGQRMSLESLREEIAGKPEGMQLVWREDGVLLATVWIEPVESRVWYLGTLSVRPELQAKQLGRRVMEAAEALAKERGASRMRISVIQVREALMEWYERRGYVKTGETKEFPYGDERFGRPLREDLFFVVLEKGI
jgi:GNAT superfamily N-acetyltransferase